MKNYSIIKGLSYSVLLNVFFIATQRAHALSLKDYLEELEKRNTQFESARLQKQNSELKKSVLDVEQSPYLILKNKYYKDESYKVLQYVPTITQTMGEGNEYTLGLKKKFSTGTNLELYANEIHARTHLSTKTSSQAYYGTFSANLTQSLWKDFFGRQSRLRKERDELVYNLENASIDLGLKKLKVDAEAAYWQLLYLKHEVQARKDSLSRAEKLVQWNRNRLRNGLAQEGDLLQTEALYTQRELQFLTSQDELKNAEKQIKDFLFLKDEGFDLNPTEDINESRENLVSALDPAKHLKADAWLSKIEKNIQLKSSLEYKENLRPELSLLASYTSTAFNDTRGEVTKEMFDNKYPNKSIGLQFVWNMDFLLTSKMWQSASAGARAAELKSTRLMEESTREISELKRRYQVLTQRVNSLKKLTQIQKQKFEKEQSRFRNGRSTTFQVISFEQEVAESELLLNKLLSEQRKMESSTQLFVEAL